MCNFFPLIENDLNYAWSEIVQEIASWNNFYTAILTIGPTYELLYRENLNGLK